MYFTGQSDKIMELLLQGYDHILDVVDEEGTAITEVINQRGDEEMNNLLVSIPAFEVRQTSTAKALIALELLFNLTRYKFNLLVKLQNIHKKYIFIGK